MRHVLENTIYILSLSSLSHNIMWLVSPGQEVDRGCDCIAQKSRRSLAQRMSDFYAGTKSCPLNRKRVHHHPGQRLQGIQGCMPGLLSVTMYTITFEIRFASNYCLLFFPFLFPRLPDFLSFLYLFTFKEKVPIVGLVFCDGDTFYCMGYYSRGQARHSIQMVAFIRDLG